MNDFAPMGATRGFSWHSFNWWGLFLVVVGLLWLADMLQWIAFDWKLMGPMTLVFAGIMAFLPRRRGA